MFSMAATERLSYQWMKNGSNIARRTSPSYTTPATALADSGSTFQGIATHSFGWTRHDHGYANSESIRRGWDGQPLVCAGKIRPRQRATTPPHAQRLPTRSLQGIQM